MLTQYLPWSRRLQGDDGWANGVYEALEPEYESKGGAIRARIPYLEEEEKDLSSYLEEAESAAISAIQEIRLSTS